MISSTCRMYLQPSVQYSQCFHCHSVTAQSRAKCELPNTHILSWGQTRWALPSCFSSLTLTSLFGLFSPAAAAKSLQSCPTLCDPIDGSPAGAAIPGILQARTLECYFLTILWVLLVILLLKMSLSTGLQCCSVFPGERMLWCALKRKYCVLGKFVQT